ncbi:hypothetical protein, partial [Enterococcus faecium]|uniref:hypothetical protein n=1 Tax=Enterococcus faecium TaxID=1352 RepID=UPI003D9FF94B
YATDLFSVPRAYKLNVAVSQATPNLNAKFSKLLTIELDVPFCEAYVFPPHIELKTEFASSCPARNPRPFDDSVDPATIPFPVPLTEFD